MLSSNKDRILTRRQRLSCVSDLTIQQGKKNWSPKSHQCLWTLTHLGLHHISSLSIITWSNQVYRQTLTLWNPRTELDVEHSDAFNDFVDKLQQLPSWIMLSRTVKLLSDSFCQFLAGTKTQRRTLVLTFRGLRNCITRTIRSGWPEPIRVRWIGRTWSWFRTWRRRTRRITRPSSTLTE